MTHDSSQSNPGTGIITALDYADPATAMALVQRLDPQLTRLKVGKELFTAAGPALVEQLQKSGFEVFLDLKFHDIPHTVAGALRAAEALGVWMVNVHASGGPAMLEAARQAVSDFRHGGSTRLIAVTVLTSLDQTALEATGIPVSPARQAARLATLSHAAGLDGVVCSAQEVRDIRALCGAGFLTVTPGIRPASSRAAGVTDDQRRTMTPREAAAAGSSYVVIGRPITGAVDPVAALAAIQADLRAGTTDQPTP